MNRLQFIYDNINPFIMDYIHTKNIVCSGIFTESDNSILLLENTMKFYYQQKKLLLETTQDTMNQITHNASDEGIQKSAREISQDATSEITQNARSEITQDTTSEVTQDTTSEVTQDTTCEVTHNTINEIVQKSVQDLAHKVMQDNITNKIQKIMYENIQLTSDLNPEDSESSTEEEYIYSDIDEIEQEKVDKTFAKSIMDLDVYRQEKGFVIGKKGVQINK